MLRSNLSTRPFYNERAVQLLLLLAGVIVLALTAFNVIRIVSLSQQNTELSADTVSDRDEAERLRREAASIRSGINQAELKTIVGAAQEANVLIDHRTFSWTEFFNRIEETLPADVMLTEVQPSFEQERTVISMTVIGRRTDDVAEFLQKLQATRVFKDPLAKQRDVTEEGFTRVLISSEYVANGGSSTATAATAGSAGSPPAVPAREAAR
jgi:Tfp pilus assembly protein PilN